MLRRTAPPPCGQVTRPYLGMPWRLDRSSASRRICQDASKHFNKLSMRTDVAGGSAETMTAGPAEGGQDPLVSRGYVPAALGASPSGSNAHEQAHGQARGEIEKIAEQMLSSSAYIWEAKRRSEMEHRKLRQSELAAQSHDDPCWRVGQLAKLHMFDEALQLMGQTVQHGPMERVDRISHKVFMDAAADAKQAQAALSFLETLPKELHDVRVYTMALQVCASSRDTGCGIKVVELAEKNGVSADTKMYTAMIHMCAATGSADLAFRYFAEMRAAEISLDAHVYGALVSACAEAMQRELSVAHERKDQYVLLERAMNLVEQAESSGIIIGAPVYNSLLMCAGRAAELARAFEIFDHMVSRGFPPDAFTFGSLIEASVTAGQPELAHKIYLSALRQGFTHEAQIYTSALNACKLMGAPGLALALDIHSKMQNAGVMPDKKFYAALIAVAGKAQRMDLALEILQDAAESGVLLTSTLANALMYAAQGDLKLMRRIYDSCALHGVYPQLSQFNRMMDTYAQQSRFGEVISLACDMVHAGYKPNLNTYRILINACQRADQAQLALEVYAIMRAKRIPILQNKFAQSIFFSLLKACFNQIRNQWARSGCGPAAGPSSSVSGPAGVHTGSHAPWHKPGGCQVVRKKEAVKLLAALRFSHSQHSAAASMSGAPFSSLEGHAGLTGLMQLPAESINWQQHAIMAYRDMLQAGFQPSVTVIDMLVRSLRLRLSLTLPEQSTGGAVLSSFQQHAGGDGYGENGVMGVTLGRPVSRGISGFTPPVQSQPSERSPLARYEATFDRRAFSIVEEAMSRGHLPSIKGVEEGPATIDLRGVPPSLAEIIVVSVLSAFEKRSTRLQRCQVFHNVTFRVPSFNPDYTMWPSWLEKQNRHYDDANGTSPPQPRDSHGSAPHVGSAGAGEHSPAAPIVRSDTAWSDKSFASTSSESDDEHYSASRDNQDAGSSPEALPAFTATAATGLAVAATCRRLKVYCGIDPGRGTITLDARETSRWLINRRSYELQVNNRRQESFSPNRSITYTDDDVVFADRTSPVRFDGSISPSGRPGHSVV